jgi:hypothetical protein
MSVQAPAVITIGIDPMIHLGPITIAWHGLTIAIGIVIGGLLAAADRAVGGGFLMMLLASAVLFGSFPARRWTRARLGCDGRARGLRGRSPGGRRASHDLCALPHS